MTWSQTGAKQVGMVGMDEKRAFTLVVGVTADGSLLPFQAVFVGKTMASVPSATDSPNYNEAINAGFKFECSGTGTLKRKSTKMVFLLLRKALFSLTCGRSIGPRNFESGCA